MFQEFSWEILRIVHDSCGFCVDLKMFKFFLQVLYLQQKTLETLESYSGEKPRAMFFFQDDPFCSLGPRLGILLSIMLLRL